MGQSIINLNGISKKFMDHTVLDNISLDIRSGEVCCILGENGAGKSTLMKILSGIYTPDNGSIMFEGKPLTGNSPQKAQQLGIRMIYQESQLIPELTVSQNIFLKNEVRLGHTPILNQRLMNENSKKILGELQCSNIDVRERVNNLGCAQLQLVEIARALAFNAKVIIFDEPTSALVESEVQNLFRIIARLKALNVAIIYISHKIGETKKIADRIVIMRDGMIVDEKERQTERLSPDYFVEKMAGRDYINRYPRIKAKKGDTVFRVENLWNQKKTVRDLSLKIDQGEIIGLAGLQGSGKSSVAKMIYGLESKSAGAIFIDEKEVLIDNPRRAREKGISYMSEKITDNIFMLQNTSYNYTIATLNKFRKNFHLSNKAIDRATKEQIAKYYMKIPILKDPVKNLSIGILQKLALAKLVSIGGRILVLDDPSKNMDIPSKVELYNILNHLTKKGVSILLISSDTEELIGMCDRVYIMFNGTIVKELNTSEATSAKILHYASSYDA
ncbi:MAG TPA: sugar ABC transporter ATP-binding protein [Clostridia bacterium]|nr:sugar ABC transporter ATP-binding protein [Clostridia bacterium]